VQGWHKFIKKHFQYLNDLGTVMVNTTITAIPSPAAALIFFEIAKKVHIPRKYAKAIFSMNTAVINKFK